MITKEQTQKLVETILSFSTYPECDISIRSSVRASIRFALNGGPFPAKVRGHRELRSIHGSARNQLMIPHVRAIVEGAKASSLVAAGFFERAATTAAIANKKGNFGYGRTTDAHLSTTIRNADGLITRFWYIRSVNQQTVQYTNAGCLVSHRKRQSNRAGNELPFQRKNLFGCYKTQSPWASPLGCVAVKGKA